MIDYFSFRARARRWAEPSVVPSPAVGHPVPAAHPLAPLLETLRLQNITLVSSGRRLTGRLIATAPPTLAGADGGVTVLQLGEIELIEF